MSFELDARGLHQIFVAYDEVFDSMASCSPRFAAIRRAIDAQLGPSRGDNLAATWETTTATVSLACGTAEGEEAAMSMAYLPR